MAQLGLIWCSQKCVWWIFVQYHTEVLCIPRALCKKSDAVESVVRT